MNWRDEVIRLHRAFEAWFCGSTPADAIDDIADSLDERFVIVGPDGAVTLRPALITGIERRRGAFPDLTIEVSEFATVMDTARPAGGRLVVGRYAEIHRTSASPPTRRIATAVLGQPPGGGAWSWLAVHETWSSPPD